MYGTRDAPPACRVCLVLVEQRVPERMARASEPAVRQILACGAEVLEADRVCDCPVELGFCLAVAAGGAADPDAHLHQPRYVPLRWVEPELCLLRRSHRVGPFVGVVVVTHDAEGVVVAPHHRLDNRHTERRFDRGLGGDEVQLLPDRLCARPPLSRLGAAFHARIEVVDVSQAPQPRPEHRLLDEEDGGTLREVPPGLERREPPVDFGHFQLVHLIELNLVKMRQKRPLNLAARRGDRRAPHRIHEDCGRHVKGTLSDHLHDLVALRAHRRRGCAAELVHGDHLSCEIRS
mmetsp:Transcript_66689/g.159121  ORF Transcript_66689/g.159121 Transcript_66689/m.159121 type:complete len:291 (-) Transcript_66689:1001-1873(-)